MQFWKVFPSFKILNFRGSYEDRQYEQNNLGEKDPHNLQNLTCKISNFHLQNRDFSLNFQWISTVLVSKFKFRCFLIKIKEILNSNKSLLFY